MKSESKSQEQDGEDGGDGQEGEADIVEEDDILANPRVEPHVEEKVEPGKSDRDGAGLPLNARSKSSLVQSSRVADRDVEGEEIDDQVKEKDEGKPFDNRQWLPP